jgi:hypothetical protein
VPFWNESAALQAVPPGRTAAFFDAQQNQLVLVRSDSAGSPNQVRFDIPNATDAAVAFSIQKDSSGATIYSYSLTDDLNARQRSQQFSILLPAHDLGLKSAPSGTWHYFTTETEFPDRTLV